MSTDTLDPVLDRINASTERVKGMLRSPAAAANGAQMKQVLEQGVADHGVGERLAALPKASADRLRGLLQAFKVDALKNGVGGAWQRLLAIAGGLLGKLSMIGYGTLAGVLLTAGGLRRTAVTVVFKAYRIITTPVRMVGWLLRKVGLGKVVDWFGFVETKVLSWIGTKVEAALTWMDTHENSGAMRWGRAVFQATFIQRALRLVFPWASGAWVFLLSLFVPSFGMRKSAAVASEEAAIKRAADKLRDAGEAVAAVPTSKFTDARERYAPSSAAADRVTSAKARADEAKAKFDAAQPVEEAEQMVRDTITGTLYQVVNNTITVDGVTVQLNDLPEHYEVGEVILTAEGEQALVIEQALEDSRKTAEALKAAAATVHTQDPQGSRDNRRAGSKHR